MVCSDNKHVLNNIENGVKKESQSTVEAGATVDGIRWALKHVNVKIKFQWAKANPRTNKAFRQQHGQMLMKECDE